MAELVSRGSVEITILDLTDNKRILSFIGLNLPRYVIYNPDTNSYNPDYRNRKPILSPYLQVDGSTENLISQAESVTWYLQNESMGQLVEISNSNPDYTIDQTNYELTINSNVMALHTFMTYHCEIEYKVGNEEFVTLAEIELVKIVNGTSGNNPVVVVLDNDADRIHTDAEGNGGNFTSLHSTLAIYDGTIDVTANWSIQANVTDGVVGVLTGSTYKVNDLLVDGGKVTFIAIRGDQRLERIYSIDKVKSGRDGEINRIFTKFSIVKKDQNDVYNPPNLMLRAQKKTGVSDWSDMRVAFRVYSTLGDTDYKLYYQSSSTEEFYNYHVEPHISDIRVEIYDSTAYTTLLDTEHIPVVVDGKDNIFGVIETPTGIVSRNGETILDAVMRIYVGNTAVAGESYRWYKMDPEASGDSNSGEGWKPLTISDSQGTTGFSSDTLTVPPQAINSSETFMCITSYRERRISSTITFSDINDPYIVSILGSGIFKNSEGINTYTVKVYQNGVEVDTDPTTPKYRYTWNMYDQADVINPNFNKTGRSITVSAEEIRNRAVLTCTVENIK